MAPAATPQSSMPRLRLLAAVFGLLLALTLFEELAGGGWLRGKATAGLVATKAVCGGAAASPAPPRVELPVAERLLDPKSTLLFDQDVVANPMGLFGRFLRVQRADRARKFSSNEWRDRRHTFPLITGDGFRMLADWYADDKSEIETLISQANRDDTALAKRLKPGQAQILFFGNDDPALDAFLDGGGLERVSQPVVLVVINGDNSGLRLDSVHLEDPKLLAVFTQNCVGQSAKVRCIPIGLENRQWSMHGWTPETIMGSMLGNLKGPSPLELLEAANATAAAGREPPPIAFACFGVHTWREEREPLARTLDGDRKAWGWVSRDCHKGLVQFHRAVLDAAAVIAPRGHGLDTLRAWESMYLGRPIVTRSLPMDPLWEDLPVVLLKSWDELSYERVAAGVRELSTPARLARSRAATHKLFLPYWACELGKAAGRPDEFCTEAALLKTLAREEGA